MISLDIIEREISELEARDTSYATVERLAWLYTCRDHLLPKATEADPERVNANGSDFLCACDGACVTELLSIIDELMAAIQVTYPKMYNRILSKIESLKK